MANPQLTDYVRQQQQAGLSKEEIQKYLASAGWQQPDIEESFVAATEPPKRSLISRIFRGIGIALTLIVLLSLVLGGFLVYSVMHDIKNGVDAGTGSASDKEFLITLNAIIVQSGLRVYQENHGSYPATLSDLTPDILHEVPTDPVTKEPFEYTVSSDGSDYELCSSGSGARKCANAAHTMDGKPFDQSNSY